MSPLSLTLHVHLSNLAFKMSKREGIYVYVWLIHFSVQ